MSNLAQQLDQEALHQATILVIDDESTNLLLMEKLLRAEGFSSLITLQDPREVMDTFQKQEIDLVILDLNMPYMDGFEVMQALMTSRHDIPPILMLTAQGERETRVRALEQGVRDYITKPFDRHELLARVRNQLEMRLLHKELASQNHNLESMVKVRTQALYDTRLEVVRRLGRAAEFRDNETGLHIIRMSKMSARIGQAAGMGEREVDLLLNASPMHDIGKIGIPDHVLLKPGKFEPEEWEIMKTHATIGGEILSGSESRLLEMAREIALTHHEKWDGTGYPNALQGEGIPLVGRIVALADVFDALTSERPYKNAWPVEEAVDYIRAQSGAHFDPALVTVFLEVLPDLLAIRNAYAEPGHLHE